MLHVIFDGTCEKLQFNIMEELFVTWKVVGSSDFNLIKFSNSAHKILYMKKILTQLLHHWKF